MMTIKVHYSTTRAIRLSNSSTYQQVEEAICKKFEVQLGSLTLWSKKKNGDLKEVTDETVYKEVVKSLDDGFRLTLWAYDKHEVLMTTLYFAPLIYCLAITGHVLMFSCVNPSQVLRLRLM